MIHHDTPWYTMIHHDTPWYTMIHYDTPWYTMIHHDTPWYTMIHHDTRWYTMIHHDAPWYPNLANKLGHHLVTLASFSCLIRPHSALICEACCAVSDFSLPGCCVCSQWRGKLSQGAEKLHSAIGACGAWVKLKWYFVFRPSKCACLNVHESGQKVPNNWLHCHVFQGFRILEGLGSCIKYTKMTLRSLFACLCLQNVIGFCTRIPSPWAFWQLVPRFALPTLVGNHMESCYLVPVGIATNHRDTFEPVTDGKIWLWRYLGSQRRRRRPPGPVPGWAGPMYGLRVLPKRSFRWAKSWVGWVLSHGNMSGFDYNLLSGNPTYFGKHHKK